MALTKEHVLEALRTIKDSGTQRDLVEMGAVAKAAACDGVVSVTLACADDEPMRRSLRAGAEAAVRRKAEQLGEPIARLGIDFVAPSPAAPSASSPAGGSARAGAAGAKTGASMLPGVRHVIAVGAGKGGVGKSTIAANLAVGLARAGHAVGLLDGDIYGPSMPTLLGLDAIEVQLRGGMLQPFYVHGVKAMTIGKLVDAEKPLIWRGPMAHGAFKQLVEQTEWGELDSMIIDLPPGTGDVSLTMAQVLAVTGAVIVCTPQKVAQDDAVRAARMFQTLGIVVLGVVENMSYFMGDDGKEYDLFGRGGAEKMAQRLGLPFLGAIPIHMALRENSDAGNPTANFTGHPGLASALEKFTQRVEAEVALATMRAGAAGPTLTIS